MNFIQIDHHIINLPEEEFVKYISEVSPDINLIQFDHEHLIFWLIELGKLNLIKRLKNLDLNISDPETPLHRACRYSEYNIVKYLLDEGADVNKKGDNDNLPIHYSYGDSDIEIISLLLEKGADINAKNKSGNTVLSKACQGINLDMIEFLLESGIKVDYKEGKPVCLNKKNTEFLSKDRVRKISELISKYQIMNIKSARK